MSRQPPPPRPTHAPPPPPPATRVPSVPSSLFPTTTPPPPTDEIEEDLDEHYSSDDDSVVERANHDPAEHDHHLDDSGINESTEVDEHGDENSTIIHDHHQPRHNTSFSETAVDQFISAAAPPPPLPRTKINSNHLTVDHSTSNDTSPASSYQSLQLPTSNPTSASTTPTSSTSSDGATAIRKPPPLPPTSYGLSSPPQSSPQSRGPPPIPPAFMASLNMSPVAAASASTESSSSTSTSTIDLNATVPIPARARTYMTLDNTATLTAQQSRPSPPPPISKEEIATIEYYLRQALAAKDLTALTDLVARATEKRFSSDLVSQARSLLADRATEERENEVSTLKHYMKQSLASRRAEPIRDVLKKVDPVAAAISSGPHRRLHTDFFALVDESHAVLEELEKEDAQTVSAYLRQGVQVRSREVLQAALQKSASVRHELLDEFALNQAKALLSELDAQVLVKNYLQLAIKSKDLAVLDETIAQAQRANLPDETPELIEARKVADDLRSSDHHHKRKTLEKEHKLTEKLEKERLKTLEKEAKAAEKEKERLAAAASSSTSTSTSIFEKAREKTRWFGSSKKGSSGNVPKPLLFGGPLSEAIRRNAPHAVPKVCADCMAYLRLHGLQEAGLFRVAGNNVSIGALKDQYEEEFANEDGSHPVSALTEIHDASGLFKLYFRMLPEPLIPFDYYDRFIKVGNNKGVDRISQLTELIKQLPKENIGILSSLFRFLNDVSHHSGVNKMTPDNLAIVFAPNLLRPKVETPQTMMNDMPSSISIIASFIGEQQHIFESADSERETPASSA